VGHFLCVPQRGVPGLSFTQTGLTFPENGLEGFAFLEGHLQCLNQVFALNGVRIQTLGVFDIHQPIIVVTAGRGFCDLLRLRVLKVAAGAVFTERNMRGVS